MPCTDTSNLAETLVSLARKLLGSPSVGNTLEAVTLGDSNDIDVLVLLEDGRNLNGLFEEFVTEVDLVSDRSTIDLDLHEVSLLLGETSLADLSMGEDTDDRAVFADALELTLDGLATILSVLLGVAGEGLLLGSVPVLVESALDFVRKVVGPNGGEGAEAARGLDIADESNGDHRRCLDNGNSFDNLSLVEF